MNTENWTVLKFDTPEQAERAFIACSKGKVVPVGSYVLLGLDLRIKSPLLAVKLRRYLQIVPYKTYASLKGHYIDRGLW